MGKERKSRDMMQKWWNRTMMRIRMRIRIITTCKTHGRMEEGSECERERRLFIV